MTLLNYLDIRRLKTVLDYIAFTLESSVFLVDQKNRTVLYETGKTARAGMNPPLVRREIENCVQNAGHESEIAVYTCRKNLKMVPFPLNVNNALVGWIVIGPFCMIDDPGACEEDVNAPVLTRERINREIRHLTPIIRVIAELMHDKLELKKSKQAIEASYAKQRRIEKALEETVNELKTIFENSQVGIMYLQGGRFFMKGNQRLADILGWENPEDMEGIGMDRLHLSEKRFREFGEQYFNSLAHGKRIHIEYELAKKDGTPVWCMLSGKAVDKENPADLKKGVIWVIDDISKQKAYEDDLSRLAATDFLTGLNNRAGFETCFDVEIERAERNKSCFAFLLMDVDFFKQINDRFGHDAGDLVLKNLGRLMKNGFREIDVLGRVGGEEFAAILPGADEAKAFRSGERFRKCLSEQWTDFNGEKIQCTVSLGISVYHRGDEFSSVYKRADRALYAAKHSGRNRTRMFSEL